MTPLKICYVSSEVVPFAKTGGLADVAGALPVELKDLEQDVRVMMANYKSINERKFVLREVIRLKEVKVKLGNETKIIDGKTAFLPNSKVHVYFLHIPDYFDRKDLYVDPATGQDYEDNAERFAFFSKSVLETLKLLYWQPDIIHCNEWQTALIPFYLKTHYKDDDFFKNTRTVLSLHNLAYQGSFSLEKAAKIGIDSRFVKKDGEFEHYGRLNLLRGGILFSDVLNTVSEKYAEEITTDPEYGAGFEKILYQRRDDLYGILNGVDYSNWNPETDNLIPKNYSIYSLHNKEKNKKVLCNQNNLPFDEKIPLVGVISRLADQKGFDLIAEVVDEIFSLDIQFVLLGTGDPKYHVLFEKLSKKFPRKLSVNLRFDNKLAHLIEAGADMFLMPSKYEPCGLNQLYSLKYGTVPVVRETGGLADTIQDFDPKTGTGNGFTFKNYNSKELLGTIKRALQIFSEKKLWQKIQLTGMKQDYSWLQSARKYLDLYEKAMMK
jgi:starch synthase